MAFPQHRISLSRESWGVKNGNPKTQENLHPHPAFLQNRILARPKSARSIKRFRILHGRLDGVVAFCRPRERRSCTTKRRTDLLTSTLALSNKTLSENFHTALILRFQHK